MSIQDLGAVPGAGISEQEMFIRRAWLLSWNPENWNWSSLPEDRRRAANGNIVTHSWRCGARQVKEGDEVYLMRTGLTPRGIVAHGNVLKASYEAPHYDKARADAGETTWFIDAGFDDIRDATKDAIVPIEELKRAYAAQAWSPQSSGITVEPMAARILSELWHALPSPREDDLEALSGDLPDQPHSLSQKVVHSVPTVWVEKTLVQDRSDRQEGPDRLGMALWSPQRAADGRDIYANMRDVGVGDLVLHLTDNEAITGVSVVAEPLDTGFAGVPGTKWAGGPCYRIALRDFHALEPPLRREWFFGDPEIGERLRILSTQPRGRGLFFSGKLELNQGSYLTEAPPSLVAVLNAAYLSRTGKHIPMLSAAAQEAAIEVEEEDDLGIHGSQPPTVRRRSWVYSPGQQAVYWDEFYQDGIMGMGWNGIGDFEAIKTIEGFRQALEEDLGSEKDQGQNAKMCFDFVHTMQPGDVIYAKRGRQTFVGRGIVEDKYYHDPLRPEFKNVRKVRWTARGEWPSPDKLPMKTLTEWTNFPALLSKVENLITEVSAGFEKVLPPAKPAAERQPYSAEEALDGLFMPKHEFTRLVETWTEKKNLVLQGAPGVGKTFVARRLAYALMGYKDPTRVRIVQFHQSYGYEDFVQGYRPSSNGFTLREGVFLNFCARALEDPDERYVFIIDEINRGNLSKILGELMLLIEPDKRSTDWAVKLAYAENAEERFYVPSNVFILGMMNTADRSLAVVDYALRRRFAFATVPPAFGELAFRGYLLTCGVTEDLADQIIERMIALNIAITADTANLGRGYCIGHSFFTPPKDGEPGQRWYRKVIETEIVPLLEEYWFDQPDKVSQWQTRLLA